MASAVTKKWQPLLYCSRALGSGIEQSDNTAADVLLHNFRGPSSLQKFLQDNRITGVDASRCTACR
jgi:beta-lactamase class A